MDAFGDTAHSTGDARRIPERAWHRLLLRPAAPATSAD